MHVDPVDVKTPKEISEEEHSPDVVVQKRKR